MRNGQFFKGAHHARIIVSAHRSVGYQQGTSHNLGITKRRNRVGEMELGRWNMSTSQTKRTALITGASSGMGAIYADGLAGRGYDLILVGHNRGCLAALTQRLKDETGRSVETIAADLNDKADLARIETMLRSSGAISPEALNGVCGSSKAFVLALSHSLSHELAGQGVRVQAVLFPAGR